MHPDYTTKVCSKCHESKPLTTEYFYRGVGVGGWEAACKTCLAAQRKAYKAANKEREAAANAAWYQATIDTRRQKSKEKYQAHKETILEYSKAYYKAHKKEHKAVVDKWAKAHPEAIKAKDHRRRAKEIAAEGRHTGEDIKAQYHRQKGKCYYCGCATGKTYHVDHVVPLSRGGSDAPENLVIACRQCNLRKADKLPHEWAEGGRLL